MIGNQSSATVNSESSIRLAMLLSSGRPSALQAADQEGSTRGSTMPAPLHRRMLDLDDLEPSEEFDDDEIDDEEDEMNILVDTLGSK